jgi:hypothetical protein
LTAAGPATAFGGKSWSFTRTGGLIQLRAAHNSDNLNHDEWVSVPVTATTTCTVGNSTWTTAASGSGSNQAFQLLPNTTDPQTSVTAGGGSVATHFGVTLPSSSFTATAGTPFTATFSALDVCNNPATGYSGSASLTSTLGNAPNGATPTVPSSITFASGSASANITAVAKDTGQTLTATAGAVTGTSDPFAVQAGPPDHIGFTAQPSLTKVGTAISPAVQVTIFDQFGNVSDVSDPVSLSLAHDPTDPGAGDGTLSGGGATSAVHGVATFSSLSVDKSSNRYFLQASDGALNANSAFFDVVNKITGCGSSSCSDSVDNGLTGVTVNVPSKRGASGNLALGLDNPGGSVPCTRLDGTTINQQPMAALQTILPPSGHDTPDITVVARFDKSIAPGFGVANFVFCANHGGNTPFFEIPPCPRHGQPTVKCEVSRHRNGVGDLVVTFLFSSTDPVGSGFGP